MACNVTEGVLDAALLFVKQDWREWNLEDGEAWSIIDDLVAALNVGLPGGISVHEPIYESCHWIRFYCPEHDLVSAKIDELPEGLRSRVDRLLQAMIAEGVPDTSQELFEWEDRWIDEWADDSDQE